MKVPFAAINFPSLSTIPIHPCIFALALALTLALGPPVPSILLIHIPHPYIQTTIPIIISSYNTAQYGKSSIYCP
ncbi:hypothetical protein BDZ45DRAFT_64029 [Acephala macrosclerotiorum]|nr:hypothetical protein BDZ45DRAFT_64029 [Acephala macrosclerotiorum]